MKKKILVVDDSPTVRQQVSSALKQVGFDVLEACDGLAGIEAIERDPQIAVVVCDVNMPRMNGLEMLKKVKSLPKNAALSIIMLTTEQSPGIRQQAKDAGAKGWMVKPFNATHLIGAIQKLAG